MRKCEAKSICVTAAMHRLGQLVHVKPGCVVAAEQGPGRSGAAPLGVPVEGVQWQPGTATARVGAACFRR
jgi:hypothetical protein